MITYNGVIRTMNTTLKSLSEMVSRRLPLYACKSPSVPSHIQPYGVGYDLSLGSVTLPLVDYIGREVRLEFLGSMECVACAREIKKTFAAGYCYVCFRKLPQADMCMVKPEQCHYSQGSCRDSLWGEKHCMIPHSLYLSVSSGLKVGITRSHRKRKRWVDQGAYQALELGRVRNRLSAGNLEVLLKQRFYDRTRPLAMLKASSMPWMDLESLREDLKATGELASEDFVFSKEDPVSLVYPWDVEENAKLVFKSLDKQGCIEGVLKGIKGQYWIVGDQAFSLRKHAGYRLKIHVSSS